MKWIIILSAIVLILWTINKLKSSTNKPTSHRKSKGRDELKAVKYISRCGETVEADDAFEAWTSGDLDSMVNALDTETNLVDRHFLLMALVDNAYKVRSQPVSGALLRKVAEMHIAEFPEIEPVLEKNMGGTLPRVSTFQKYATYLTEIEEYERAIEVCEIAISFGLKDNTKSGYEGRIERIKKKIS